MAKFRNLARPAVRSGTRFHGNKIDRKLAKMLNA